MSTKYARYQDCLSKDGRLVCEFDEMYQDFDDPWGQLAEEAVAVDKKTGKELIKKYALKRIIEIGWGFGMYLDETFLRTELPGCYLLHQLQTTTQPCRNTVGTILPIMMESWLTSKTPSTLRNGVNW